MQYWESTSIRIFSIHPTFRNISENGSSTENSNRWRSQHKAWRVCLKKHRHENTLLCDTNRILHDWKIHNLPVGNATQCHNDVPYPRAYTLSSGQRASPSLHQMSFSNLSSLNVNHGSQKRSHLLSSLSHWKCSARTGTRIRYKRPLSSFISVIDIWWLLKMYAFLKWWHLWEFMNVWAFNCGQCCE